MADVDEVGGVGHHDALADHHVRRRALPFSLEEEDYVQILTDIAGRLGPALGRAPLG